jgi:hypothetical protein
MPKERIDMLERLISRLDNPARLVILGRIKEIMDCLDRSKSDEQSPTAQNEEAV